MGIRLRRRENVEDRGPEGKGLADVRRDGAHEYGRVLKVGGLVAAEVVAVGLPEIAFRMTGNAVVSSLSLLFVTLPAVVMGSVAIVNAVSE